MQNAEKRERIEEKKYNKKLQNKIKKKSWDWFTYLFHIFLYKKAIFFCFSFCSAN